MKLYKKIFEQNSPGIVRKKLLLLMYRGVLGIKFKRYRKSAMVFSKSYIQNECHYRKNGKVRNLKNAAQTRSRDAKADNECSHHCASPVPLNYCLIPLALGTIIGPPTTKLIVSLHRQFGTTTYELHGLRG